MTLGGRFARRCRLRWWRLGRLGRVYRSRYPGMPSRDEGLIEWIEGHRRTASGEATTGRSASRSSDCWRASRWESFQLASDQATAANATRAATDAQGNGAFGRTRIVRASLGSETSSPSPSPSGAGEAKRPGASPPCAIDTESATSAGPAAGASLPRSGIVANNRIKPKPPVSASHRPPGRGCLNALGVRVRGRTFGGQRTANCFRQTVEYARPARSPMMQYSRAWMPRIAG